MWGPKSDRRFFGDDCNVYVHSERAGLRVPVKRRIAPKALTRFKARIRELTRRTRGVGVDQVIATLERYLTGWCGYFGFCETPGMLKNLDEWIGRRSHCFLRKQWKRGWTRFQEQTAHGVSRESGGPDGEFPTRYLAAELELGAEHRLVQSLRPLARASIGWCLADQPIGTAVYGPVRTVW